ncbi:AEC family transporter [Candidatus Magnetomonas plexicatena]|uniref:AEC family transporter n=1 Tax=Candidatus Magnetomonas plexicatena TaxID=2552947 RepID=UPI001C742417|nr:AEC family transporter [Nitrospirales bacterium LBB_01]
MYATLLSFTLIVLTGVAFRRLKPGGLDADTVRNAINATVLNIFLPALCIKIFSETRIDIEAVLVPMTAALTICTLMALTHFVFKVIVRFKNISMPEVGALIICASFGNTTYLGLPVITELYGQSAQKYVLYFDLMTATPILWLIGAQVAARYGGLTEKISKKQMLYSSVKTVLMLPPIHGVILGGIIQSAGIPLPEPVFKALSLLGSLVVPLMIFSIGLAITVPKISHVYCAAISGGIKLIVSPLLAYFAAKKLGLDGVALNACTVEGAMPSMVLSLLIAARFNLDVTLAAFMIVSTTACSLFTLPVIVKLLSL